MTLPCWRRGLHPEDHFSTYRPGEAPADPGARQLSEVFQKPPVPQVALRGTKRPDCAGIQLLQQLADAALMQMTLKSPAIRSRDQHTRAQDAISLKVRAIFYPLRHFLRWGCQTRLTPRPGLVAEPASHPL